jgi:hypothetical protein|tara:strand:+ start:193 stop:495 length:303 start_codon:yes stop_codon:yes gene_type:complete
LRLPQPLLLQRLRRELLNATAIVCWGKRIAIVFCWGKTLSSRASHGFAFLICFADHKVAGATCRRCCVGVSLHDCWRNRAGFGNREFLMRLNFVFNFKLF